MVKAAELLSFMTDPILAPYNVKGRQNTLSRYKTPEGYSLQLRRFCLKELPYLESWLALSLNKHFYLADDPENTLLEWQATIAEDDTERTYTGYINRIPCWMIRLTRAADSAVCCNLEKMGHGDYAARLAFSPRISMLSERFLNIIDFTIRSFFQFPQLSYLFIEVPPLQFEVAEMLKRMGLVELGVSDEYGYSVTVYCCPRALFDAA